jgi:hypothetical protein
MKIIIDPKKLVEVMQQHPHLATEVAKVIEQQQHSQLLANQLLNSGAAVKIQSESY